MDYVRKMSIAGVIMAFGINKKTFIGVSGQKYRE